jgi:phosphoribosylamine--glycine ligase
MQKTRRVLVVGGGGREHALAWKLAADGAEVFAAPGNAGTAQCGTNLPIEATDIEGLLAAAKQHQIDLVVVGPEAPLVAGLVDVLTAAGVRAFGPSAQAAQLEGSKIFCKDVLHAGDIPTAMHRQFHSMEQAREFLEAREDEPVVVKADGLAAGKGVFVCDSRAEAIAAIEQLRCDPQFSKATRGVLIEERLDGVEVSVMAITDGRTIVTLPPLQDHKAAHDGDQGPNTGGMGAFCPAPFVDDALRQEIEERILVPTVHTLRRRRTPFHGVLYGGLMLTAQGPKVLEFNVRFGDPECQALLIRMESSLLDLLDAAVDRRLADLPAPRWRSGSSVSVVMASEGYPDAVTKDLPIRGLDRAAELADVEIFHAATRLDPTDPHRVLTAGGRVLAVTATGSSLARAKLRAYEGVREIRWRGGWCRKDIADKGLRHERDQAAAAEPDRVMPVSVEPEGAS